ncbi:MAG: hypothetical protein QOI71_95 [Gaiellales bacterium]|nr:hypothetical protein [Gaiellales bacterium]
MYVNNEITERGLLHRLLDRVAVEVTMDERTVWARSIDGAIKDAARSSVPMRNRVARPIVVLTAAPALSAVAAALRSEEIAVTRETLDAVREFMTNGIDSPLYGRDPLAARRAADALRSLLLGDEAKQRASATTRDATAA